MTNKPYSLLAISGSTRANSSNMNLIRAVASLGQDQFATTIFEGLELIPAFNPDITPELTPKAVLDFRVALRAADGILICTPEYAAGVPGVLKNAIDWTVGTMEFSQKPLALITASTSGYLAHQSLLGTLLIIEAKITGDCQFVIPFVKTKVNAQSEIIDAGVNAKIIKLIDCLGECIHRPEAQTWLQPPSLVYE